MRKIKIKVLYESFGRVGSNTQSLLKTPEYNGYPYRYTTQTPNENLLAAAAAGSLTLTKVCAGSHITFHGWSPPIPNPSPPPSAKKKDTYNNEAIAVEAR